MVGLSFVKNHRKIGFIKKLWVFPRWLQNVVTVDSVHLKIIDFEINDENEKEIEIDILV